MKENIILNAAVRAGSWLINTQNTDYESADCGRFIYALNLKSKQFWRSSGWQTAFGVFALLSLHKLTKDERYLKSASIAMRYLKTLQILDQRKKAYFGAIREVSPQTEWSHPRDALSVAWAMLAFYLYTNDHDSLERSIIYADWMLKYAFFDDWIVATVNLGNKNSRASEDILASCQSGTILFLIELYKVTLDLRYYEAAFRMSNYYINNFIDEDGVIKTIKDKYGNNNLNDHKKWPKDWQMMHMVNDDFGGISLIESFKVFKRDEYKQRCSAYLKWLKRNISKDGSFFQPTIEVGSATTPLFLLSFMDIADFSEKKEAKNIISKNLKYLLSIQQNSNDKMIDGAFLGMDNCCRVGNGNWINIRCTAYSVIAFCRYLNNSLFPLSSSGLI